MSASACKGCGCMPPVHSPGCRSVRKAWHPKRWSCASALMYAEEHAMNCNADAVGVERSIEGNPEGAARLCAWALARKVRGAGARL